jgi:hypothetical protein
VDSVFKDVDNIPAGVDFVESIPKAMQRATIQLVIIGSHFLDVSDLAGGRRLDNPDDYVRLEVEAGLRKGIPVIPILLEGVTMAAPNQWPSSLARLSRLNALSVRHDPDFSNDMRRVIAAIERAEEGALEQPAPSAAPPSAPISPAAQAPQPAPPSTPIPPTQAPPQAGFYQGAPAQGQPMGPGAHIYGQPPMSAPPYRYPQGVPFTAPPTAKLTRERRKVNVWLIVTPIAALLLICVVVTLFAILPGILSSPRGDTATPTDTLIPVTPTVTPVVNDPLTTASNTFFLNSTCFIQPDGLHLDNTADANHALFCTSNYRESAESYLTVTVKQVKGSLNNGAGLLFHKGNSTDYRFEVSADGEWHFVSENSAILTDIQPWTTSGDIHTGLDVANTLMVHESGAHFDFYVNGTLVGSKDDHSVSAGTVGACVEGGREAVFTNFTLTNL